ncbi:hypothetical protein BX600DRAFT_452909 [Xylariales sp. PMI_506]|nr:hypothetical protein BX600DRAFT_452909 [Xylariales sp. PMI_506]
MYSPLNCRVSNGFFKESHYFGVSSSWVMLKGASGFAIVSMILPSTTHFHSFAAIRMMYAVLAVSSLDTRDMLMDLRVDRNPLDLQVEKNAVKTRMS